MRVSQIMILRDGGTILFNISRDPLAGKYRLQTPFGGKPEPLFRDERKLDFGSTEEVEIARKLKELLGKQLNESRKRRLSELDELKEWRNIPWRLDRVVPYHRIRHVLHILETRPAGTTGN